MFLLYVNKLMRTTLKALKALSNNTRLRILNLLMERECCVCEVIQALDISQSTASHALAILYDAGFLKHRKKGYWSYYSIDKDRIERPLYSLLDFVAVSLETDEVTTLDRKRLKEAKCFDK